MRGAAVRATRLEGAIAALTLSAAVSAAQPHNVILFVPDGLRAGIVDASTAPNFARIRDEGVNFVNSHSLFPTFTTANASAFATGHELGDTGDFGNVIYTAFPVQATNGSVTPFLEIDRVLDQVNTHFNGNYLNEEALVVAARAQGLSTAIVGKIGPAAIFDLPAMQGTGTLIIDDSTGHEGGIRLPPEWQDAFRTAKIDAVTPSRGDNGNAGDKDHPGTWIPAYAQQQYFLEVTSKVVLPRFKVAGKPFVLIYWSRDPDGTLHNQGDSLGKITPGINGPTSLAAVRIADAALGTLSQALRNLGLAESTDIIVASDHGFSTIAKTSETSPAARINYRDVAAGALPMGFLAIDLAVALHAQDSRVQLFDPDSGNLPVDFLHGQHPVKGNGAIGTDSTLPEVIIAAYGGSDLIYIPPTVASRRARALAARLVDALLTEDYVSGLFVDRERVGLIDGTLSLTDIALSGGAITPVPAIVVNFRSFGTGCDKPVLCAAEIADSRLQQGQGMHGSFSRADTWNFMAAQGPDFRAHYVDQLPASNSDVGMTVARILHLDLVPRGRLVGRVLTESLGSSADVAGPAMSVLSRTVESRPAANGLMTVLKVQQVGATVYFDAAGFPSRTVGLE